ncbi:hypothetical protein FC51_GL002033 [Lentilactobacillus parabuchneri DSM 5707 = NBRC 107865]|jgi:uncharacterized membrane protein|uniref:Integral membrane protein n=2 Tax=Lentilactobacillus parabuchneri TaxID=152331 RepID=A0A0R1Z448_9LACO|nr:hypothetical protein FC51_GL002033 [Lentilactobacillus parabuchneri DSM 5707 = NBRC 107865]KRN71871.1 hypothetical protein IV42_GL001465 [Lentilactobacillus parabuchneri]
MGVDIMNRAALKLDAKSLLNAHFKFFFLLFLPVFILELVGGFMSAPREDYYDAQLNANMPVWSGEQTLGTILIYVGALVSMGVFFVCVDAMRQKLTYDHPFQKSMTIFNNVDYFLGSIVIYILEFIFVMLWMILLIVPGIIKAMAYSQSFFIYRDAVDCGEKISYLDAITRSRKLMDGHKWEYFVMALSFIGWGLLVTVTLGIAAIWVQPYMALSFANYYRELVDEHEAEVTQEAQTINNTPVMASENQPTTTEDSSDQSDDHSNDAPKE